MRRLLARRVLARRVLAGRAFAGRAFAGRTPRGLARLLGGLQHAAAATLGAAAARVDVIDVGRIVVVALYLIVVAQFLAAPYGPNRLDEDALVQRGAFAVRIAAMVDVPRLIPVHARVDHGFRVHREQKRVIVVRILVLVARVRFLVAHALTQIFDDGRALADAARGEHAESMDGRVPHFEQGSAAALRGFFHTAMGALMAS